MPRTSPWKLPPGPQRRERLAAMDLSITSEDYTAEELTALGVTSCATTQGGTAGPAAAAVATAEPA